MRLDSHLSRMNCQTFSMTWSPWRQIRKPIQLATVTGALPNKGRIEVQLCLVMVPRPLHTENRCLRGGSVPRSW